MADDQHNTRNAAAAKFAGWMVVGVLFMIGCIAPISFFDWIPAALLAAFLIWRGVRSPRYFFSFAAGIGITLFGLGIVNGTYRILLLYGTVVTAGGIVFYSAFGPRTSHAEPPSSGADQQ
ncbi:MAG: hypothetical protein KDB66_07745 [Solirubrobacterales bacterium]|nr:hypothetical protein [Solirubrobacterales bacterium]MCB8915619.1 hypothetical protein [Thermoleophilales bacterium]